MFHDFLINISVFTSILFIFNRLLKHEHIIPLLSYKVKVGIGQGLLGIILMFFTIHVTSTVIVDLRHLAIVTAAFLGGLPAALITGVIIGTGRVLLFGGITDAALIACLNALLTSLLSGIIAEKVQNRKLKWFIINGISIAIFAILTSTLFEDKNIFIKIFMYYSITSIIGAILSGFLLEHLWKSNYLEKELVESEERNRRLIEFLPEPLIIHSNGKIIYSNKASQSLLAEGTDVSILNNKFIDFVHADSLDIVKKRLQIIQQSIHISLDQIEEKLLTINKKIFYAEVKSISILYKGELAILTIFRDITERKITEEKINSLNNKLQRLASVDGLTGIANRRTFDETFSKEWGKHQLEYAPLSIILFDIDYFKLYNDNYGHGKGDECLKQLATAISEMMQGYDNRLFARYGGEEFVVLAPNMNEKQAVAFAEEIRSKIESLQISHDFSNINSFVTCSIGVASCIPSTTDAMATLLERADIALYQAKKRGRNRVETHYEISI